MIEDIVITKVMKSGPIRVPVMVKKRLAAELAEYIKEHGRNSYDKTLESIIRLGIDASRRRSGNAQTPH